MGELELYGGRLVPGAEVVEGEVLEGFAGAELADLFVAADEAGCEDELFAWLVGAEPVVRPEGACVFCFSRYGSPVVPGAARYSRRWVAWLVACEVCAVEAPAFREA